MRFWTRRSTGSAKRPRSPAWRCILARQGSDLAVGAIVLALLGGSLTSYVRARAESLGIECTVGWISRTERVFIMGVLLVVHLPEVMAYVLALATCFTALQRILHVRHALVHGTADAALERSRQR